jgi:hypothetical protein
MTHAGRGGGGVVFLFRIWNVYSKYAYVARPLCSGLRRLVVFLVDGLTAFRSIMSQSSTEAVHATCCSEIRNVANHLRNHTTSRRPWSTSSPRGSSFHTLLFLCRHNVTEENATKLSLTMPLPLWHKNVWCSTWGTSVWHEILTDVKTSMLGFNAVDFCME